MIIQRGSLRTKNKTCSKEYPLREYITNPCNELVINSCKGFSFAFAETLV